VHPFDLPLSALHAVGCLFDCPNIVCPIVFPNFNQTPKQNYPSQLEKISRYPKENKPEVFLNMYPYTNLTYNVISAYLNSSGDPPRNWVSPPLEKLSRPLKKCLGHAVCITIVFVPAVDVKFRPPSEISSPPWCPKLVTGLLVTVALWLLSVMPLNPVFSQSNFSGLSSNFNTRN